MENDWKNQTTGGDFRGPTGVDYSGQTTSGKDLDTEQQKWFPYRYPNGGALTLNGQAPPKASPRKFDTGATRNSDEGKPDYEGFISPLVVERFGRYMHKHRKMEDGSLRDSDNWQKGIPRKQYLKSLLRHIMDVWLIMRGREFLATAGLEEALCAVKFNVDGLLHEVLMGRGADIANQQPQVGQLLQFQGQDTSVNY